MISFDRVSDKLKNPAGDEQRQGPAPAHQEERQRDDDQRNADAVGETVQRMPVFGFVVCDEIL